MTRLAAFLIALAVGAAPVALEVCQLTCASPSTHSHVAETADPHAMHHGGAASQPSCHETGNAAAHTVAPGSTPCDHNDAVMSSSLVTTRPDTIASAPVHIVVFELANSAREWFADRDRVGLAVTRLELRLSSPLRI